MQRAAVAGDLLADADARVPALRACRASLLAAVAAALGQRQPAQVLVAVAQQVERDQGHRLRSSIALDVLARR